MKTQSHIGNNKITIYKKKKLVIVKKEYSKHLKNRKIDSFKNELLFYKYLNKINCKEAPKLLNFNSYKREITFSFLKGRKLNKKDITMLAIKNYLNFLVFINQNKNLYHSKKLNYASDYSLSINNYFKNILDRIIKTNIIIKKTKNKRLINKFNNLNLYYENYFNKINKNFSKNFLNKKYKIISPSDVGFHNVLKNKSKFYFFDFEYAGFDDPSKMISDFFLQPKYDINLKYLKLFHSQLLKNDNRFDEIFLRTKIIMPITAIKWTCIILGIFDNDVMDRRLFSNQNIKLDVIFKNAEKKFNHLGNNILKKKYEIY